MKSCDTLLDTPEPSESDSHQRPATVTAVFADELWEAPCPPQTNRLNLPPPARPRLPHSPPPPYSRRCCGNQRRSVTCFSPQASRRWWKSMAVWPPLGH